MFAQPMRHCCCMNLERFGKIVLERRLELGLTQSAVSDMGGPTDTTLGKIENGEWSPGKPTTTLKKLDIGLKWPAGTAARVLEGEEPTLVAKLPAEQLPPIEDEPLRDLEVDANRASEFKLRVAVEEGFIDPEVLANHRRTIRAEIESRIVTFIESVHGYDDLPRLMADAQYSTIDDLYALITGTESSDLDLDEISSEIWKLINARSATDELAVRRRPKMSGLPDTVAAHRGEVGIADITSEAEEPQQHTED